MKLIEARYLTKRFGDVVAVDSVSFAVGPGEIVGLLGANGAGKTTTMRMLLGLLPATEGQALIDGTPVDRQARMKIGYVPQGLGLYRDLTVLENLAFTANAYGVKPPSLAGSGLEQLANRLIGDVSLGVRRRTAFLAARCHEPMALILDEPTSGVGPLGRARLWETIHQVAEAGAAVLVSTHYMDEAEECDRAVLMAQGREVVSGTISDIVGGLRSVFVAGDLSDRQVASVGHAGGTALRDLTGWRIVGLSAREAADLIGRDATDVPASFEEAFVALSK